MLTGLIKNNTLLISHIINSAKYYLYIGKHFYIK